MGAESNASERGIVEGFRFIFNGYSMPIQEDGGITLYGSSYFGQQIPQQSCRIPRYGDLLKKYIGNEFPDVQWSANAQTVDNYDFEGNPTNTQSRVLVVHNQKVAPPRVEKRILDCDKLEFDIIPWAPRPGLFYTGVVSSQQVRNFEKEILHVVPRGCGPDMGLICKGRLLELVDKKAGLPYVFQMDESLNI